MFIDITVPLSSKTVPYEGDSRFNLTRLTSAKRGNPASYNISRLEMSAHMGTHVDAPLHFVQKGLDVASLELDAMNGEARVVDLRGAGLAIDDARLGNKNIRKFERVLLKTDNCGLAGKNRFSRKFAHLTRSGAAYLRNLKVKLVGIDYLSVDPWGAAKEDFAFPAHHELLDTRKDGAPPAIILENINLKDVKEGKYLLWCFPLKIAGGDGAPARAVLETL